MDFFNRDFTLEFLKDKFNLTKQQAYEFLEEYNKVYYKDLAKDFLREFRSRFPDSFDFEAVTDKDLIEIGKFAEKCTTSGDYSGSEDFLSNIFKEFIPNSDPSFFVGKQMVLHIKKDASGSSKRCNCILCDILSYNKQFIYVKNNVDNCVYCISTAEIE